MLQIQLYVENDQGVLEEVELYKDESVTLTQSIQDIMDIEKVFTDYSKTFNVPASKTNNKFFKHFYNYHIDGFDARRKKNAELHLNYKPFKKGKIKLEGTQLKNNEPHTYKLTFFGNTVTLKDLIGEDKLGSLTYLDSLSFLFNDTNIASYMTDGLDGQIGADTIENAIIIPLITHTDRLIYHGSDDTAGTNNLWPGIGDTNARGVNFNQLKPAIRVYTIIKAIEKKYQIEFSEDFFNQTNLPFYNLYMWLHAKEGSLFEDQEAQYTIQGFTNVRGDTNHINGVHTSFFTNSYDESKEKRSIRVKVTPSSNDEYSLVIKQNGEEFKKFSGITGTTTNGVSNNVPEIEIPNGDYTFFIEAENAATFAIDITIIQTGGGFLGLRGEKQITFSGTAGVLTDQLVNVSSNLPKMKTLDFITGIFKMFNLTSFVKDDGTIVVKSLDSFYAESVNTWDITKHLDKEESIIDSVIPYRQVNIGYEGGDTFLAKNHENLANKKWGTLEFAASDNFEGNEYNIKIPFEHMKFERLRDVQSTAKTNIQWGWSVDSKQESTIGEPILFYASPMIGTIAAVTISGTRQNIVAPFVPSNSLTLTNFFGTQSQSLNFHTEFDEFTEVPNENTLFQTYYKDYVKDLFDKQKRLTFVSAYLPMSITERLSLEGKIIVFNNLYRINKITTNFETNKSELELSNILQEKTFKVNPYEINVDLSNDLITADTTLFTADIGNILADGFTIIGSPVIADIIASNDPVKPTTNIPCVVTAATISSIRAESFCEELKFYSTIATAGKICDESNIDEYGFLLATQESYLNASDDIDTLKANSNIQVVSVKKLTGYPTLTTGEKVTTKTRLTDPQTYYARFYVRTNTTDLHPFSDVISQVFTETTNCGVLVTADMTICVTADNNPILNGMRVDCYLDGQVDPTVQIEIFVKYAGAGDNDGYLTQPTLDTITQNGFVFCDDIVNIQSVYHNGQGEYPIVGDNIKYSLSDNYFGGSNSLPYDGSPNDFGSFALADNDTILNGQGTIFKYFVFKISTAEVVAVYDCPPAPTGPTDNCDSLFYEAGGSLASAQNTGGLGFIGIGSNVSGLNSTTNNKTTVATFVSLVYSNNYNDLNSLSGGQLHDAVDNYVANGMTPSNVFIQIIEESNPTEDNSSVTFNSNGFIQNGNVTVRKNIQPGTYYARMTMGWCGQSHIATQILTTQSLAPVVPFNKCDANLFEVGGRIKSSRSKSASGQFGILALFSNLDVFNVAENKTVNATWIGIMYSKSYGDLVVATNASTIEAYLADGTTPSNVSFEIYDSETTITNNTSISFDSNGFIENGVAEVYTTTTDTSVFYTRMIIGWCDEYAYAGGIKTTWIRP